MYCSLLRFSSRLLSQRVKNYSLKRTRIMSDPRVRTLKIKTGVVKRLAKEKVTYEKEAAQQRERIQKLKEQGENCFSLTQRQSTRFSSAKRKDLKQCLV